VSSSTPNREATVQEAKEFTAVCLAPIVAKAPCGREGEFISFAVPTFYTLAAKATITGARSPLPTPVKL
jgi:hypothetical protein